MSINCTPAQNKTNLDDAMTRPIDYYTGIKVTILKSAAGVIQFTAAGSAEVHKATWGDITQMWSACPCAFPTNAVDKNNPGAPPQEGDHGELFLSKAYVEKENLATRTIYTPTSDPKWPRGGAAGPAAKPVRVCATNVIVSGFEMATADHAPLQGLDIMDPMIGSPVGMHYDPASNTFTISLTEEMFAKIGVEWDSAAKLAEAELIISGAHGVPRDPSKLVWAWRVVEQCKRSYAADKAKFSAPQKASLVNLLNEALD